MVGHILSDSEITHEIDFNLIVPSLLKRWKRLEVGLDTSAKSYDALCKHFKDKIKQWLKQDKAAQRKRQEDPAAMDIYDTVKQKGMGNEDE